MENILLSSFSLPRTPQLLLFDLGFSAHSINFYFDSTFTSPCLRSLTRTITTIGLKKTLLPIKRHRPISLKSDGNSFSRKRSITRTNDRVTATASCIWDLPKIRLRTSRIRRFAISYFNLTCHLPANELLLLTRPSSPPLSHPANLALHSTRSRNSPQSIFLSGGSRVVLSPFYATLVACFL